MNTDNLIADKVCYNALLAVFRDGAFSVQALNDTLSESDESNLPVGFITSLFYGVLEKSIFLDYIIEKLIKKSAKTPVEVIVKMGIYMMRFMSVPDYAVTNRMINLAKSIGKGGVSGFINSVLKNSPTVTVTETGKKKIAIENSVPYWLLNRIAGDYGIERAQKILESKLPIGTHIRNNSRVLSKDEFYKIIGEDGVKTDLGCYCVRDVTKRFNSNAVTAQGLSSMIAVNSYIEGLSGKKLKVLDACGAPGGKSVYFSELCDCDITICDIYPHRLNLVRDYCDRMGAKCARRVMDATKHDNSLDGKFDLVIADVPCSCSGTIKSHPDVLFNRTDSDVNDLVRLQSAIINNLSNYVKSGGIMAYSTCSILRCENEYIVKGFLDSHPDFSVLPIKNKYAQSDGFVRLLPDTFYSDGFFVARLIKK